MIGKISLSPTKSAIFGKVTASDDIALSIATRIHKELSGAFGSPSDPSDENGRFVILLMERKSHEERQDIVIALKDTGINRSSFWRFLQGFGVNWPYSFEVEEVTDFDIDLAAVDYKYVIIDSDIVIHKP